MGERGWGVFLEYVYETDMLMLIYWIFEIRSILKVD